MTDSLAQPEHGHPEVSGGAGPSAGEIRAALARIVGSEAFAGSPQLQSFLTYIVTRSVEGRSAEIKGYTVATEALGRPADFDPVADPIVRVEARRLRKALARYYEEAGGRADPLRIVLPEKGYVPSFETVGLPQARPSREVGPASPGTGNLPGAGPTSAGRSGRMRLLFAAALVLMLAVAGALALPQTRAWLWPDARPPLVLVLPFTAEAAGSEAQAEAAGYTSELIGALARFPELRVAGVETAFAAAKASQGDPKFARRFGADYVLSGTFDPRVDTLVVQAILTRADDGRVLWSERMTGSRTPDMAHGAGRRIVQEIAQRLGQPYGVIQAEEAAHHLGPRETWSSYSCLLRTFEYWRTYESRLHLAARDCIEAAIRSDPGARDALWALSYLRLDEFRLGYNARPGSDPVAEAEALARRATELQPTNPRAFQALAAVRYVAGDKDGFRRAADEALRLGPHDPDILADIGSSEIGMGEFEAGNARLDEALRLNPVPPVWMLAWRAAGAMGAGAHEEALSFARRIDAGEYVLGGLIQLAIADMQKDEQLARSAYNTLMRTAPDVLADPAPFLHRQGPVGDAADRLAARVTAAVTRLSTSQ